AQVAYEVFKEMHPRHPKSDYVTYQLGLSLFNQLPSTIDRDLTLAERSILYFQEVIRSYPDSQHTNEAKGYLQKAQEMLADKVYYIGNFYFKRGLYGSALSRYESLVKEFPDSKLTAKTLALATRSALAVHDREKAVAFYQSLESNYSDSTEFKKLKNDIGAELGK
ncbi:MAG: outer membrane protein assembly factor BamD, partial [Bdellovibrionales bacterium]|nr:outer membrane protein assembly factor BamD [Bdellovibrionales bacterium]